MTSIWTRNQIHKIKEAGKIVGACHTELKSMIREGLTTLEIDGFVHRYILRHKARPAQIGYMGYPYATCTSVNDVICHGFPSGYVLKDGDIVKVDFVVELDGWLADSAWCYAVGNIPPRAEKLMRVTKECLHLGIGMALDGNRIGDISQAVQRHAEKNGMSVVEEFTGHGIGRLMHDGLVVPHYGKAGKGPRISDGMVFTVEPMINLGKKECYVDETDGWSARTLDKSLSAQYEHTLAVTPDGPEILTMQDGM
ncbi:MAG: type I methionyl aminopeptidase [Clostridia bacterium]